jgi:hypothetical protein
MSCIALCLNLEPLLGWATCFCNLLLQFEQFLDDLFAAGVDGVAAVSKAAVGIVEGRGWGLGQPLSFAQTSASF